MKITLLQQETIWISPLENQKAAEQAILSAPKSDIYVLPEMWSTGFVSNPEELAESDESSLTWMKRMANQYDAVIAGSVATNDNGKFFNRFYFVKPQSADEEQVTYYDKHHLFTYGNEHKHYSAGEEKVIVEWRGVRFLLLVCYDLRFPTWSRNSLKEGETYDCILYVASWPTPRINAWNALLIARAIENQCYVCGVNRVGSDPICTYTGGTVIINAYGKYDAQCKEGEVDSITSELDMGKLFAFRTKFPVLGDADSLSK